MIGQQVTLSGYAGWLKVADTVIEAVLVCPELGQRRFTLPLGPLTLVARNSAEDHALVDRLLAEEGREGFAAAWLRAQGFDKEAQYVNDQQRQQVDAPALALRPSGHAAVLAGVRSRAGAAQGP